MGGGNVFKALFNRDLSTFENHNEQHYKNYDKTYQLLTKIFSIKKVQGIDKKKLFYQGSSPILN